MNKTRIASAAFAAIVVLALLTCFCACTQAQPLEYRIVTEPFFRYGEELAMTDHYPIFCDFVL